LRIRRCVAASRAEEETSGSFRSQLSGRELSIGDPTDHWEERDMPDSDSVFDSITPDLAIMSDPLCGSPRTESTPRQVERTTVLTAERRDAPSCKKPGDCGDFAVLVFEAE